MGFFSSATQASSIGPPTSEKKRVNRWTLVIVVIGILVVGVLFSLIYYSTALVSSKAFSYTVPTDTQDSYRSLTISDVDGQVTIQPWQESSILINGTLTARGLGSSLSTITVSNSSNNGDVVFKASFPASAGVLFSQTFSATINVYVPSTLRFDLTQVTNVNGRAQLNSINSTRLLANTVNGNVAVNCIYCVKTALMSTNGNVTATFSTLVSQGSYNLTATNANVSFTSPTSSSFKLSATVLNGYIVCPICSGTTNQKQFTQTFNGGSATVNLDSVNGQIAITGT